MTDRFYDGIRADANRTNEATGRSWHIPREGEVFERDASDREPSRMNVAVGIMAVIGIALALAAAWL